MSRTRRETSPRTSGKGKLEKIRAAAEWDGCTGDKRIQSVFKSSDNVKIGSRFRKVMYETQDLWLILDILQAKMRAYIACDSCQPGDEWDYQELLCFER